jgi:hypothetical protein
MLRRLLWSLWCLLPLGGAAYHFGPGQERMVLERADALAREAREEARLAERAEAADGGGAASWARAVELYGEALELLPAERDEARARLTLERAKSRMLCSQLPTASAELAALVEELARDPASDPGLLRDARATWANSEYYMTWLERLEGAPREEWEPRIEGARQTFKHLATEEGLLAEERRALEEDLEATILLARMDLGELQGLPLPSQ